MSRQLLLAITLGFIGLVAGCAGSVTSPDSEMNPAKHELTIQVRPIEANSTVRIVEPEARYRPGVELRAGPVTAEISADGYETQQRRFTLEEDTIMEVSLECELQTVTEKRCEVRTRSEYRTESGGRMKASATYTGPWTMPAWEVCDEAAQHAGRKLRNRCDEQGASATLSDRDADCEWQRDCELHDRRGDVRYYEDRYRCEAKASGRCEWSEDRRVSYEEPYEHCEQKVVQRRVCPDEAGTL